MVYKLNNGPYNDKVHKHCIFFFYRGGAAWRAGSSSSSSSDFLLTCKYRGHIHNSGPPSRQLACCMHGRPHTRSPGVSIMRVDSQELPLSAIPLCQLLPSHVLGCREGYLIFTTFYDLHYRIYSAIRQGFPFSKMTTNN